MLEFHLTDKEIDHLYHYCDMDEQKGLNYPEFIVLLCLVYLLAGSSFAANDLLIMAKLFG